MMKPISVLVRNEHPIVTANEALRAIKIVISAVTCMLRARNCVLIHSLVEGHGKAIFKLHEANRHNCIFKLKQSNVYAFVMFKIYLFMPICNQTENKPYLFQCF